MKTLRIAHILLPLFCMQTTRAQETISYRSGTESWATASNFAQAYAALHTTPASSARFTLHDVVFTGPGTVTYTYWSTPFVYAFWNYSAYNCEGYAQRNVPADSLTNAISNVIAQQAKGAAANPGMCIKFDSIVPTGNLASDGMSDPWIYYVPVDAKNMYGTNHDKVRAKYATAQIKRSNVQKCDCDTVMVGNPINVASGAKFEIESDYSSTRGLLKFVRNYNSQFPSLPGGMGNHGSWQHNFERRLFSSTGFVDSITALRPNFDLQRFSGSGTNRWSSAPGTTSTLTLATDAGIAVGSKFKLYDTTTNVSEFYDNVGILLEMNSPSDDLRFTYSTGNPAVNYPNSAPKCAPTAVQSASGQLICVTNKFGQQINFSYNSDGWLIAMYDPGGQRYSYSYDGSGNLTQLTFPDGFRRIYHYNESAYISGANLPNSLTGISVEHTPGTFTRYSVYRYDSSGLATSTEHAGGVAHFDVSYGTSSDRTVTTSLGATRTLQFNTVNNYLLPIGESFSVAGLQAGSGSYSYDANGNPASHTDLNGIQTTYVYDLSRNLETKRVEAANTQSSRTFTTVWHSQYALPLSISSPLLIKTYTYDQAGHMTGYSEQATTDSNGNQGLSATKIGSARTWAYTYNDAGLLSSVTGPRTDISDITQYQYDSSGNMTFVTDSMGHITAFSNFDAYGRATRITEPNGLINDLKFSPRGLLLSVTQSGAGISETTTYAYDGVGLGQKVTFPSGDFLTYTYDDADRLIGVADNAGNSKNYVLDNAGNYIDEKTIGSDGQISREISRTYDALGRMTKIVGGTN